MRKMINGYFSLEAALILPMVLWIILSMVYLLLFQYNRCLMEQDTGILALRGAVMQVQNNEDRVIRLSKMVEEMNSEKYMAWEMGKVGIATGKGMVTVEQLGQMKVPFKREDKEDMWWSTSVCYKNHVIFPMTFIRTYRRFTEQEKRRETEVGET